VILYFVEEDCIQFVKLLHSNWYFVVGSFERELGGLLHIPVNGSLVIPNHIFPIILRVYIEVSHTHANHVDENEQATEESQGCARFLDEKVGKIEFLTFFSNLLRKLKIK
jgi:hypothetical protein